MSDAPLTIVKVFTLRNDGYAMAIHGEPMDHRIIGPAENGSLEAVADIALWRKSGVPLPPCLDPEKVQHPGLPVYATDAEYVKPTIRACPVCRQAMTRTVGKEYPGLCEDYRDMTCGNCGSTWIEVSQPIGYIELHDKRGDK